jgi:hypothetical protein
MPVRPLGLIHDGSMDAFLRQFEGNVFKNAEGVVEKNERRDDGEADKHVKPAGMEVVKDMRQSIIDVL